jgi:hypothetical protein
MSRHIHLLQRGVSEAGYYSGPLDGEWNLQLEIATLRFVRARGAPLDPHKPFNGLETQPESSGA